MYEHVYAILRKNMATFIILDMTIEPKMEVVILHRMGKDNVDVSYRKYAIKTMYFEKGKTVLVTEYGDKWEIPHKCYIYSNETIERIKAIRTLARLGVVNTIEYFKEHYENLIIEEEEEKEDN